MDHWLCYCILTSPWHHKQYSTKCHICCTLYTANVLFVFQVDFLALEMRKGKVNFLWDVGSGVGRVEYPHHTIHDGNWHRIEASRWDSHTHAHTLVLWHMYLIDLSHSESTLLHTIQRTVTSYVSPWKICTNIHINWAHSTMLKSGMTGRSIALQTGRHPDMHV